jgi:predicted nucleic acid-binding protein
LYLDTSSLVKLYIEEYGSKVVRDWAASANELATSQVALAEAMSAVSRRHREGGLSLVRFEQVVASLESAWPDYAIVPVDERVAGQLCLRHVLRGFDAIHLAAALAIRSTLLDEGDLRFTTFDHRLEVAARAEGLKILEARRV